MDATGDRDIGLHKSSPEIINELRKSLPRFLFKSKTQDGEKVTVVRRVVRQTETDELLTLLDPFQEWPQLLDPHLSKLLQPLVSAFIEYLSRHASRYHRTVKFRPSQDAIPLPRAVCQILYLFCKIRGQKVIIRFLNNEPRYLEPMLDALEAWAHPQGPNDAGPALRSHVPMVWQETFIMLWWLSYLMLTPFDLTSLSHDNISKISAVPCIHVILPAELPPIAGRLVHVATQYLGFAGKEREAAGMLLTRLALRPDMKANGLQDSLVQGIVSSIDTITSAHDTSLSLYALLGRLSFIARLMSSAELRDLQPFLFPTYQLVQRLRKPKSSYFHQVKLSALLQKLLIKITRIIADAVVRTDSTGECALSIPGDDELDDLIDYLFTALEEKDTLVRMSASKAVSLVVAKLDSDMADDVVSHLMAELNLDTRLRAELGELIDGSISLRVNGSDAWNSPEYLESYFNTANAMKWHGVILTLSQLIYRKAISKVDVFRVVVKLLPALQFEQRSNLGISIGTNVRDAACFGLWSLARRFTTSELKVMPSSEGYNRIQSIANSLIAAAILDPVGNIRRGASAALQELIGRHPDATEQGISLVQVIDYHAIALRSRAVLDVAISAAKIDEMYWNVILDALLGWRGVRSSDAETRRLAARSIGHLTCIASSNESKRKPLMVVRSQLIGVPLYKVEERHGLLLAIAHIVQAISSSAALADSYLKGPQHVDIADIWSVYCDGDTTQSTVQTTQDPLKNILSASPPTSNLLLEGECRLASELALATSERHVSARLRALFEPSAVQLHSCIYLLNLSLLQSDAVVLRVAIKAAATIFRVLHSPTREQLITRWIKGIDSEDINSGSPKLGLVGALGAVFPYAGNHEQKIQQSLEQSNSIHSLDAGQKAPRITSSQNLIIQTLLKQLRPERSIELRCFTLRSLSTGLFKRRVITRDILQSLYNSLLDYTINEKGDVGSLVRTEAVDAVAILFKEDLLSKDEKQKLMAQACSLAVEKLDKVRWRAWTCLKPHLLEFGFQDERLADISDMAQTSSIAYFKLMLSLSSQEWIRKPLLEGYMTSAGAGSASLVYATRSAFASYTKTLSLQRSQELWKTILDIFAANLSNDRLLVPIMEFIVFLFDADIIRPLADDEALWRHFFTQLQQSHYKSSNTAKIEAAIRIYDALTGYEPMRHLALKKLCHMMLHPYLKVRQTATETLLLITNDEDILMTDWSKSPKDLKDIVQQLQKRLGI